jgi:hypothetical protein
MQRHVLTHAGLQHDGSHHRQLIATIIPLGSATGECLEQSFLRSW